MTSLRELVTMGVALADDVEAQGLGGDGARLFGVGDRLGEGLSVEQKLEMRGTII